MNSRKETAIILVYQRLYGKSETSTPAPIRPEDIRVEVYNIYDGALEVKLSHELKTIMKGKFPKEDFRINYNGQIQKIFGWKQWMIRSPGLTLFHESRYGHSNDLIFERGSECSITINNKRVVIPEHTYTKALEEAYNALQWMIRREKMFFPH
jgi:hypothetical protein